MKFKLNEELKEKYQGWAQEDIDLFEAIDWGSCPDSDYDAGFAYLDSAVLNDEETGPQRIETEFHKFFKNDPYSQPYYMPVESRPFDSKKDYIGPIDTGASHKDYKVYNQYDLKK